ncbi:hypothetical protein, partial [Pedobacter agri]|uniref:hypothetical protein n=2 Tax=Pedobacter TaxID=84567 RepID=UPI0029304DA2
TNSQYILHNNNIMTFLKFSVKIKGIELIDAFLVKKCHPELVEGIVKTELKAFRQAQRDKSQR